MPYLINVTGSRIPLRRGHTYVLGRGRECAVVVPDAACSRTHASLTVANEADRVYIDDMDSRNGTYLNGHAIHGPTVVPDGGRVRIGSAVFLLQLNTEAAIADLEETCTTSGDNGGRDLDGGELGGLGLLESLRLMVTARRSVTVKIALPTGSARIELRGGEILAAEHGSLRGFDALLQLGRASAGIFWLTEATEPCARDIAEPSSHVLFELGRMLDRVRV